jgi:hypothetical protein
MQIASLQLGDQEPESRLLRINFRTSSSRQRLKGRLQVGIHCGRRLLVRLRLRLWGGRQVVVHGLQIGTVMMMIMTDD